MKVRPIYWIVLAAAGIILVLKLAGGLGAGLVLRVVMMKSPAELVFVSGGAACDVAIEKIARASDEKRNQYFKEIVGLLNWPEQAFIDRARKSSGIEEFFAGFTGSDDISAMPKEIQATLCFHRLLAVFKDKVPEIFNAVYTKYGSFNKAFMEGRADWNGTLTDLCSNNDNCADGLTQMMTTVKTVQDRIMILEMMLSSSGKGIDAALNYMGSIKELGFDRADTPNELDHAIVDQALQRMAMWGERADLPMRDKIKAYVKDTKNPLPLRWRLAYRFGFLQDPQMAPVVLEMQKQPLFPKSLLPVATVNQPGLYQWRTNPEVFAAFIEEGETLLKSNATVTTENLPKFESYVTRVSHFGGNGTSSLAPEYMILRKRFSDVLNELGQRAYTSLGATSNLLTALLGGLRTAEPINHPLPIALAWLKNPDTIANAVELCLMENPVSRKTQAELLAALKATPKETRSALFYKFVNRWNNQQPPDNSAVEGVLIPLIPSLATEERPGMIYALQSRRDHAVLAIAKFLSAKDMGPKETINFLAVLYGLNPTAKTKSDLAKQVINSFQCDPNSISLSQSLLGQPESPIDTKVFFMLLSCTEDKMPGESLAQLLMNPKLRDRIESDKTKLSLSQQKRLKAALEKAKEPSRYFPQPGIDSGSDTEGI